MQMARRQAARPRTMPGALATNRGWRPFILVCDVGHVIEIHAGFSGRGKNYAQFPDHQSFGV